MKKRGNARPSLVIRKLNLSRPKRANLRPGLMDPVLRQVSVRPKRAQQTMDIPFGMIFSLFLIMVFIVIAFIAIKNFLSVGDCAGVGQFYEKFQDKIDEAWTSQSSDFSFRIDLPSGINTICFIDFSRPLRDEGNLSWELGRYSVEDVNVVLFPVTDACNMESKKINHINISKITEGKNPYCVDVSRELKIKKGFYDKQVLIE